MSTRYFKRCLQRVAVYALENNNHKSYFTKASNKGPTICYLGGVVLGKNGKQFKQGQIVKKL